MHDCFYKQITFNFLIPPSAQMALSYRTEEKSFRNKIENFCLRWMADEWGEVDQPLLLEFV